MPDYDHAKTPPDTPPVIDPSVKPRKAAEMEADGEREGPVLREGSRDSEIATERGESDPPETLAATAATTLPPD